MRQSRAPRGTGICTECRRRVLLTKHGKLFLHAINPKDESARRVRCPGAMTRSYTPAPDQTYPEAVA